MKNIYFVVSSTPTTMVKIIRKVTRYPYNHISFCLNKDLSDLMSFSRYYYSTPFYGGYVNECYEAYVKGDYCSKIKIFELSIEDEYYKDLVKVIEHMKKNAKDYQYNSLNAILQPFHKQIQITNCYTCEDFCAYILGIVHLYSGRIEIPKFCTNFKNNCIYEGRLNDYQHHVHNSEVYMQHISYMNMMRLTNHHFTSLLQKYKKFHKKHR